MSQDNEAAVPQELLKYLQIIPDPRRTSHHNLRHHLIDIIVIAILAVISGADTWNDIESFGEEKKEWLSLFLELPNGIPSHDTFARVFAHINADAFERCFTAWSQATNTRIRGVIALDGKSVRRSRFGDSKALHIVTAYATELGIALGQRTVDGKTNEITAVPELLEMLSLKGRIVTADAMLTQKWIVRKVKEHKADYVLAVKENQHRMLEDIKRTFDARDIQEDACADLRTHVHGRNEMRSCRVTGDLSRMRDRELWDGIKSVVAVTDVRTVGGNTSTAIRYFISSLPADARQLLEVTRAHWKIENGLHWVLDVAFREDESRVRIGHAQKNLALVRKFALNLLRKDTSSKVGIAGRRKKAGWSVEYLKRIAGML